MKVVCHHLFAASGRLDGRRVDLEELDGVDGPVVLLRQLGAELGRPPHPTELGGEGTATGAVPRSTSGGSWWRGTASRGSPVVVGRERGSLVLCPNPLPGLPLTFESDSGIFVAPPLVKVQTKVPGSGHGRGDGTPPGDPSDRAGVAR